MTWQQTWKEDFEEEFHSPVLLDTHTNKHTFTVMYPLSATAANIGDPAAIGSTPLSYIWRKTTY